MRAPEFWTTDKGFGRALALALAPLGALYGLSVRLKHGGAQSFRPRARVVCVGNLTAGGTGKTPVAIALALALKEQGRRVAFLTRGYGGSLSGPVQVESGKHSAREVGDEALLLAAVAPTIVARDRALGAALADELADVIIMDDGFQNFSVAKDLSLLVIDAGGFGNGRLIPAGPLRERPEHGFARAHAAVLIDDAEHDLTFFKGERLRARTELAGRLKLEGRKVFAFCGIGKPEKFFRMLTEMGAQLVGTRSFPDHHNFSRADIERLKTRADALGAHLLTTEKDFVRLDEDAREGVLPVPIRIVFESPGVLRPAAKAGDMSKTEVAAPMPQLSLSERVRYGLETAGFFLIIGFFRLFDLDRASAIGGWIGRTWIAPSSASKRAYTNLRAAYPEKSEDKIKTVVRGMWDNLGRVLAEYAHLGKLTWKGASPRIDVVGLENYHAAKARGKGMLIISAHFANWETMPFAAREYGVTGGMVVRPTNNPYVSRWLAKQRSRYGIPEQIAKGAQGTRRIFSLLRKGEAILMLVDQRTNEGIPAPFFGRDAMTTPAPAALSLKLGAVILPAWNERLGGARFRMHVYPAIELPRTGDEDGDLLALTAAINAWVEARVRERPEQWLWIHRRWPEPGAKLRKRAQALVGAGERAESEGSSLT